MAAGSELSVWVLRATLLICFWLSSLQGVISANYQCPEVCSCLGSIVDCSKRRLKEIPADLPHGVKILVLQENEILSLPDGALQGLMKLEELDASSNKLAQFNIIQELPSLHTLKLSYNNLSRIPCLNQTSNLTHLILNHNQISSISGACLSSLSNLHQLDLNFNLLNKITVGSFPHHVTLRQLYLRENDIHELEPGCLDNLTLLESLKISKNKLSHLPKNIFGKLGKLKYLDLNKNNLRSIDGLSFQGLSSLVSLKLKRNHISQLSDGAFWGPSKIQNLQLDYNNLTSVSKGWLYGLKSLQQLSLAHNHIGQVELDVWEFCKELWELDLTHNELSTIVAGTFSHLQSLKHLKLDHNHISYIGDGAFQGLHNLETLNMSHNEISWTIEDMHGAFDGLGTLFRLGLDSNRIKSISQRSFQGLESLKQLHLADNPISSIQTEAFSPLHSLQNLIMNTSSLLCDCHLSWLPLWLKDSGFQDSVHAVCGHPDSLAGKSIFLVKSQDFTCNDIPKPVLTEEPKSQIALRGANVTLRCIAESSSDSQMTFTWKKNNHPIRGAEVVTTATTDETVTTYTTSLWLRGVTDATEGKYQCVCSNLLGTTYSQKAEITVHVFPTFTKKPANVTVRAGTTARLDCAADGDPSPIIAWQKDGGDDFPAARERRMHVMPDDAAFFIVSVKSDDQGVYSCTATNAAGTVVANTTLNVLKTPAFVQPMEDRISEEGETVVLECLASGSPKPRLHWLKDGEDLKVTDRHFLTADNQLLIIVKTKRSDEGSYTCVMSNTLGTERGTAGLTILPLHPSEDDITGCGAGSCGNGLDDDSTTTGIIIIAVVCCVVGTSLVWVIIIYQTRKRSEEYSSTPTDETTLPGDVPTAPYHHVTDNTISVASPGPAQLSNSFTNTSLTALHQVAAHSDSDTVHSDSPSTQSTRSTQSTTVLHTFQPHQQPCSHSTEMALPTTSTASGGNYCPHHKRAPPIPPPPPYPHLNTSQPCHMHTVNTRRISAEYPVSRPPDEQHECHQEVPSQADCSATFPRSNSSVYNSSHSLRLHRVPKETHCHSISGPESHSSVCSPHLSSSAYASDSSSCQALVSQSLVPNGHVHAPSAQLPNRTCKV